jgi:hypothetical protein
LPPLYGDAPTVSMPQLFRMARVVLGVTAACTLAGAAASVPVTAVFVLAGNGGLDYLGVFAVGATFGAVCGLLLGPAIAFGFLRGVPLGRLFAETAAGAGLGGAIAALSSDGRATLWGAGIGLAAAVAHLFLRFRKRRTPSAPARDEAGDA